MRRLLYRLLHRQTRFVHPKGYIIHSEYRWFPPQVLTNLCVWDGTTWHQAPLHHWDRTEMFDYLGGWIMGIVPDDPPSFPPP